MKRTGAILLASFMCIAGVAALTACGDGDSGDTATTKTVKVWVHKSEGEDEGRTYRAIEEAFNEQELKTQDGRTIVMKITYKNDADSLRTSITGENITGGLPDVFAVDSADVTYYAYDRLIVPIDEYLTDEVKNDYVDSVIDQSTYEGKIYALSGMDAPGGLYYNKTLLKSVGYSDTDFGTIENPWSWKDVMEAMDKLKAAGKKYQIKLNLGFGGNEGQMYLHSSLVYSAGGSFANAEGKTVGSLNSEASLNGLGMFADLVKENKTKQWIYSGSNENAFPGEEVAFEIYGPWLVNTIHKKYKSFENNYDIMPYPIYEDAEGNRGTIATPCGSWGFAVSKDSKDKYAAAQVVAYLTGTEASELLYDSVGTFPTHKSFLETSDAFSSGALKSLSDLLQNTATARPKIKNYRKLRDQFSMLISYIQVNAGEKDYDLAKQALTYAKAVDD